MRRFLRGAMLGLVSLSASVPYRRAVPRRVIVPHPESPRLAIGDWVRLQRASDTSMTLHARVDGATFETLEVRLVNPGSRDTAGVGVVPLAGVGCAIIVIGVGNAAAAGARAGEGNPDPGRWVVIPEARAQLLSRGIP